VLTSHLPKINFSSKIKHMKKLLLPYIIIGTLLFSACKKYPFPFPGGGKIDIDFYGLTHDNGLIKIEGKNTWKTQDVMKITNLPSEANIVTIDFRPATGQLYGLGSNNMLYIINLASGMATPIGTEPFAATLDGAFAGFDFNPTVDRIRLVTSMGKNLRLHPETGAVAAVDAPLNPGSPQVAGAAYTNSFAGATNTALYDIDINAGKLFKQDPPNDGKLVEVGTLGVAVSGEGGFDISPDNKYALAAFSSDNKNDSRQMLYRIDLSTGKASVVCDLDNKLIGLAIPTNPVAYAADKENNLHIFDPTKPETTIKKQVMGLQNGETITGLDMRPATGQLYALGSSNSLYTINTASGAASPINTTAFATAIPGVSYGFDFNPTVDRIRVVSSSGQNLRLHPVTGVIAATDANLNPGNPGISGAAYTNNFPGATATVLYDIDHISGKLYKQDPPNDGKLTEVGSLGINIDAANGFDIGGSSNKGYALLSSGNNTKLYMIDLVSGKGEAKGSFPAKVNAFAMGLGF
jgi:hypothetical protein